MRLRALPPALALTATLAACATAPAPPAPSAGPAPAPIEGYDWIFHEDAGAARLVYGVAESDDVRVALDCERGAGRLALTAVAGPDAEPTIVLESGGKTERFAATAEEDLVHDGLILSAMAEADAPVFLRFRQVGWLALWADGARQAYAPHPGSEARIERFFAFCG